MIISPEHKGHRFIKDPSRTSLTFKENLNIANTYALKINWRAHSQVNIEYNIPMESYSMSMLFSTLAKFGFFVKNMLISNHV